MRKKAYRQLVADQRARLLALERDVYRLGVDLVAANGHLQRIRIAHEPLCEAIFPPTICRATE